MRFWGLLLLVSFMVAHPAVTWASGAQQMSGQEKPMMDKQMMDMMMGQGFQGRQIVGYDLYQNKYVSFWIDSMSTAFFLTSGMLNAAGNVMTETGTWPNPMTGGTQKVKFVTTFMPDGKYTFEMFMSAPDGKEFKSMELRGTRKM